MHIRIWCVPFDADNLFCVQVMAKFLFRVSHTVLLWFCVMGTLSFLSRAPACLAFPPPPPLLLFALNLPCRLVAVADALLGMVNSDLLLCTATIIRCKAVYHNRARLLIKDFHENFTDSYDISVVALQSTASLT
jgi:hypothetical protein